MKKVYAVLAGLLLFAAAFAVFACFDEDPASRLNGVQTSIPGGDGSITDVTTPGEEQENSGGFAAVIKVAYPVTLNLAFSGFLADGYPDPHPISRMCVVVFDGGRWVILHDVRNPQYKVETEEDERRALFGRYTIPHAMAQHELAVLLYFENSNGKKSFDLEKLLDAGDDLAELQNLEAAQQLRLVNSENVNPM